eukprot:TRINITY_DN80847_c0_g1_i1.p1 TRINITY_DN80847_c0_g1~~TRINITY_DN80847_c0_g1_i1.p1  ORF type:complete len:1589 (+),score=304.39 TRINITY_DN80847_c0_g1_i1:34-4800(+)
MRHDSASSRFNHLLSQSQRVVPAQRALQESEQANNAAGNLLAGACPREAFRGISWDSSWYTSLRKCKAQEPDSPSSSQQVQKAPHENSRGLHGGMLEDAQRHSTLSDMPLSARPVLRRGYTGALPLQGRAKSRALRHKSASPRRDDWECLLEPSSVSNVRNERPGGPNSVAKARQHGLDVRLALQAPALRRGGGLLAAMQEPLGGGSELRDGAYPSASGRGLPSRSLSPINEGDRRRLTTHNMPSLGQSASNELGANGPPGANSSPRKGFNAGAETEEQEKGDEKKDAAAALPDVVDAKKMKMKIEAKRFEATLSSFQELINADNSPASIGDMMERLAPSAGGSNFAWDRCAEWQGGYGASLQFSYQLILWYQNWNHPDIKTRTTTSISFMHKPGCAYVYQPLLPVTSLMITPRSTFRPMFDMDPRSFHTFKLAWRHFLDFGVSDYRIIVGEQLERWTQRCKAVIEKPLNAVYWLMIMVGSHYRETLVQRKVLKRLEDPSERIPVICVDSFVALSALLFSPERQVLYAGVDPTPSYLQWLQYIGDQHSRRKEPKYRRRLSTVFETNEFFDLSVIIVFYGRIQQKVKESMQLSWVGNPTLIKSYIGKYAEDNRCHQQIEPAVRLYTLTSALGKMAMSEADAGGESNDPWYTWNGMKVCEVGVPMPCTQASFLSPFTTTSPVVMLCPVHGPDAVAQKEKSKKHEKPAGAEAQLEATTSRRQSSRDDASVMDDNHSEVGKHRMNSRMSGTSKGVSEDDSQTLTESEMDDDEDTITDSLDESTPGGMTESQSRMESASDGWHDDHNMPGGAAAGGDRSKSARGHGGCICGRYMKHEAHYKRTAGNQAPRKQIGGQGEVPPEIVQALQALGDYDVMHCFTAILAGGLNLAKRIIRLHFSVDPKAYGHLPSPNTNNWQDGMLPWYRELHRPDAHGRSRYSMLLESVVHGLLGDGFTSGFHDEVLDILRVTQDVKEELKGNEADKQKVPMAADGQKQADNTPTAAANVVNAAANMLTVGRRASSNRGRAPSVAPGSCPGQPPVPGPAASPPQADNPTAAISLTSPSALKEKTGKSVLSDIVLWTELYESESLINHRVHFESFVQWCSSAQLIPFLVRCYRRCGVAGLVPDKQRGGHKHGVDPTYPLVLPTVSNFCYGHCYPLHRVLEYFYGGMEHIVCSCDDPQVVDEDRNNLGLIAGQERLNNQCWFQLSENAYQQDAAGKDAKLSVALLQQLQEYLGDGGDRSKGKKPAEQDPQAYLQELDETRTQRRTLSIRRGTFSGTQQIRTKRSMQMEDGVVVKKGKQRLPGARPGTHARKGGPLGLRNNPSLGVMVAEDPFFWFCQQNFAVYTYPASSVPRNVLNEGRGLVFRYCDFVSRTGTPERSIGERKGISAEHDPAMQDAETRTKYVPPSINLCQPTETTEWVRQRWEIKKEFVDEKGLILGDAGWFPGALGHRFTFEVMTEHVERYVRLGSVPQAQLLYVEYSQVPRQRKDTTAAAHKAGVPQQAQGQQDVDSTQAGARAEPKSGQHDSESSSSDSEDNAALQIPGYPPPPKRADYRKGGSRRGGASGSGSGGTAGQMVAMMLPPLLPAKTG